MNPAIQCIILLACTITCISAGPIRCSCVGTTSFVDPKLIASVTEYGLRPYCNKAEVIVTLKDDTKKCLDPAAKFTIKVVQVFKDWANRVAKINSTDPGTTTSPGTSTSTTTTTTTTTTVVPTSP